MAGVIGTWTPSRFCFIVNAEIDSMGVVDVGVHFDTTTSPRQAATEKAQAKLRQEYVVREERQRELEFLEKGGNPLDFKCGISASTRVRSTSVRDQLLEHEEKDNVSLGNFYGDSAGSSGHPDLPSLNEPNFGNNLLLFDGKRNDTRTGKSKGNVSSEQLSKLDDHNSVREAEDIFHIDVKSQVYDRRNRPERSLGSPQFGLTDLIESGQGKQATSPSSQADGDDTKIQHWEVQVADHVTICNMKQTSLKENNDSKNISYEVQLGTELDVVRQYEACANLQDLPADKINIISENIHENHSSDHLSLDGSEQKVNDIISTCSKLVSKGGETLADGVTDAACISAKQSESVSTSCASCFSTIDEEVKISQNQDQVENFVFEGGRDVSLQENLEIEPVLSKVNNIIDGNTIGGHLCSREPDVPCIGGRKERKLRDESTVTPNIIKDNGDLRMGDAQLNGNKKPNNALPAVSNSPTEVKDNVHNGLRSMSFVENTKVDESTRHCNLVSPLCEHLEVFSQKGSAIIPKHQFHTRENMKLKKSPQESILQEAHLVEIKLKRAGESPLHILHSTMQQKSHWDFVLEEMAWLANDFMQERLWKITTSSQICSIVATSDRSKFENLWLEQKAISRILANAVIRFWSSAEKNKNVDENTQLPQLPVKHYAARFLQSESCAIEVIPAKAPKTPDRTSDVGNSEVSCKEQLLDELLFYKVPFGAMYAYRESVERNRHHHEQTLKITNHVDYEASVGDSAAEIKMYENLDDSEAEITMYHMHGYLEGHRPKVSHKKRKTIQAKASGFDLPYVAGIESKLGTQPSSVVRQRASSTPIPTKHVRTAYRQCFVSPFCISSIRAVPVPSKTDVSSGDTNSLQDDKNIHQGVFCPRKSSEFESTVDFEKKLPFDGNEEPVKHKKRKKLKYMGYRNYLNTRNCYASSGKGSSEQRQPVDSYAQFEQKDHIRKRPESCQFETNGTSGFYSQAAPKKPKIFKQLADTSPEAPIPLSGPITSVASQMRNMSNPNKLIKVIPNHDRGRKSKAFKVAGGQSGPGSAWPAFEDQTLVVLVHDMGPNWELISDAINSYAKFKSVFRDPKECKERHKILMDKNAGDGGDTEDLGSSQPYPSTLPGIPKGSARQLFECLQRPGEEDTLKAHFKKIIHIGQKLNYCRIQDNLNLKQISPAHNFHVMALSQGRPNNLTGGPLTPLDLCDATMPNSVEDLGHGYQGMSSSGLALSSFQGPTTTIIPASGANNMIQGLPAMAMSNSFPSSAPNGTTRDVPRYGVPRPVSLPVGPQRLQQYGQAISRRNIPGALLMGADCDVHMLSGANGMGMVCGMSRGMPLTQPGFQVVGSPGVLNTVSSESMPSPTAVGVPSSINIHPGSGHGEGNPMMRPHDSLRMLQTRQSPEDRRQVMMQELQQVTQGNGQTVIPFNGTSAPFTNQPITAPLVQTFPVQHQPHQMVQQPCTLGNPHHPHIKGTAQNSPRQQAYAICVAKERQLQQQRVGQQQLFCDSEGKAPQQNNPQLHRASQSSPMTTVSSSRSQQKQQNLHRKTQTPSVPLNQMIKERQRQQIQQQPTRQKQPPPSQAKLVKGSGRGILMHQNSPVDTSHLNGSSATGNQDLEKHVMQQNQSIFSGSTSSYSTLHQKTSQQKVYGLPPSKASKQMLAMSPHPDGVSQGQVQAPVRQALSSSQQFHVCPLASQNQAQRHMNQNHQTMHRVVLQQNHNLNSDNHMHFAADPVQASEMMVSPTRSSDSVNAIPDVSSAPVSASQWKPEKSFETSSQTRSAHLSSSSQPPLVGKKPLIPASSQGLAQRHFSGSHPVHGHGSGAPWQQQQPQQ